MSHDAAKVAQLVIEHHRSPDRQSRKRRVKHDRNQLQKENESCNATHFNSFNVLLGKKFGMENSDGRMSMYAAYLDLSPKIASVHNCRLSIMTGVVKMAG